MPFTIIATYSYRKHTCNINTNRPISKCTKFTSIETNNMVGICLIVNATHMAHLANQMCVRCFFFNIGKGDVVSDDRESYGIL